MTTTVTILGSGTPVPSAERAGPAVLVSHGDTHLLVDAGRSVVQRLAATGLWPGDLDAVFLTHHHSDHVLGLQDVVLTRWVMDRTDEASALPIGFPDGPLSRFTDGLLELWEEDLAVRQGHNHRRPHPGIEPLPFEAGAPTIIWEKDDVRVLGGSVCHEPVTPAVGYRIETPDGVVVVTGDTTVCDRVAALAEGADVLVYEAMRMDPILALPPERRYIADYHADTRLIGAQAQQLGVTTVVLTHLIPEPKTPEEEQMFTDEVREGGYSGAVIVARDLSAVTL